MKKKKKLKKSITFLVDDRMHLKIKILMDKHQLNASDIIREALVQKLEEELQTKQTNNEEI